MGGVKKCHEAGTLFYSGNIPKMVGNGITRIIEFAFISGISLT
jgi:hypothetical protein